jgi:dimethylamine/trimethylamine dehydrogenase
MDSRFEILFEPVRIGPVTAPNRFIQVPHCNGMGYRMPRSLAAMRGVKAEGGWGVVFTEEVEIHPSSDLTPYVEGRLWHDGHIPALALMAEAVHAQGALVGIELTYNGHMATNLYSREAPFGLRSRGIGGIMQGQSRRMDREDIRRLRGWHRAAALRARQAGFDIVTCYAGHNLSLAMHFLLKRYNDRTDEYGGSLENRARFLRELIEDTHEAVGDRCAVAVRMAVDELMGPEGMQHDGEAQDIIALLAELPDLWDVNVAEWENDSATSRFEKEGFQEPYTAFVRTLTTKPVVGVGRYTSPDSMASAIRRGALDFIGAARPSIADPFLPAKIREDRQDDIRECIGCNICVIGDLLVTPIRCTQNPTMGEEWRRGWHPERIAPARSDKRVMVIGGGPAGLEAARALGQRGYAVDLLEARNELGGRVALEARLPGLSEWRRVAEWRIGQIGRMPNVSVYPGSLMLADDVLEAGRRHIIVATGAVWRRDGVGRALWRPIPGCEDAPVFTPDDLLSGSLPEGRVLIYDDDHYYMGGVLAELLASRGCIVTLATPAAMVSEWAKYTLEQGHIQRRLARLGVALRVHEVVESVSAGAASLRNTISGAVSEVGCDAVVLVTDRQPQDSLYRALAPALREGRIESLRVIGDADAPHIIAEAVFAGHRAAREFDEEPGGMPFREEYLER